MSNYIFKVVKTGGAFWEVAFNQWATAEKPVIRDDSLGLGQFALMALITESYGVQGKPLNFDSITAEDFNHAMNSIEGWSASLVKGVNPTAQIEDQTGSNGVVLNKSNPNVFDSASDELKDQFMRDIMAAVSIEEIEEIFMQAAEEKFAFDEDVAIDYGLEAGQGKVARQKANDAVEAFLAEHDGKEPLTAEQRDMLSKYTGQGGLDKNSVYEYYTPQYVAESTWEFMKVNGFEGGSVGEPACGTGVFLGTKPDSTKMVANELSPISSQCSKLLNPNDDVDNRTFEEVAAEMEDNSLDSMVGNVPFGKSRAFAAKDPAYAKRSLTLDQYFVTRSIDKVRHGGLITLVLPTGIIGNVQANAKAFRREVSEKAEFLGAIRLPTNTFKAGQNGTNVAVDVILLKKHPEGFTDKIKLSASKLLFSSNVYFKDFIDGMWFKASGKKYLLGAEKIGGGENFKRITYEFDGSEENRQGAVKNALMTKFDSRIDWAGFDAQAPVVPTYEEGDVQIIGHVAHTLTAGKWVAEVVESDAANIDKVKYGAESLDIILDKLKTPEGCLTLTMDNMDAIHVAWPREVRRYPRAVLAYTFASAQSNTKRQIAWRGALTGQRIADYQGEISTGEDTPESLGILQDAVMSEYKKYGDPAKMRGIKKAKNAEAKDWITYSLAIDSETEAFSDLMMGKLDVSGVRSFDSGNVVSIIRHITAQSIKLDVEVSQIVELYNGVAKVETLHDIIPSEEVAVTGDGTIMLLEQYMTGNIYALLNELNGLINRTPDMRLKSKYVWQKNYLMENRPFTELKEVDARLTDRWISTKYIEEFVDIAGYPFSIDPDTGMWVAEGKKPALFDAQFLKYLNRGQEWDEEKGKLVKKTSGKVKSSDKAASAEYRDELKSLETQFSEFLREHEDSGLIAEHYNTVFNANMPTTFSDAPLGLENMSGDITPHGFQNSAVRQISADGKGFISLDVGLGKTFTALALIQYNVQNNRAKRSCVTVPKSVLANWYHEANSIHESIDHILFVGITPVLDEKGNVKKEPVLNEKGEQKMIKGKPVFQDVLTDDSDDVLRNKMHSIPHTNKRVVVMTSPRFQLIPLKPESLASYTQEMVDNELMASGSATDYLLTAAGYSGDERKAMRAKATKDKVETLSFDDASKTDKWQELYSEKNATKKREDYPFYEDMGFDSVIVDEAHEFKNIYKTQEEQGLKYLSSTEGSQRGIDMAMKMNILKRNNNGRGPVMLTATPITNSPIEVFNALSLVTDMSELERMGVKTADDFVRVFAEIGAVDVQKLSGEIATVDGITGFKNLKALRNLFNRFAIVKTAKDVKFDNGVTPPDANEEHSAVSLNPEQEQGYEDLREDLARTIRAMGDNQTDEDLEMEMAGLVPRPIFSIMRDMEKTTTDIDLFKDQMTWRFPDEDRAEVEEMLGSGIKLSITAERYDPEMGTKEKVTLTRPDPIELTTEGDLIQFVLPAEFEKLVMTRLSLKKYNGLRAKLSHPLSGKYAKLIDNINKHIRGDGKQIIFTEEKREHAKLLRILVANTSLTEDQIAIVNGETAEKPEELQVIADRYNSGKFKIIIANKKAEVGVNLQKGTSAIHHLTLPWTPASIQQRNGRGVRQGNWLKTVDVFYYIAGGSMDINRLDALKAKANWVGQLMNSTDERMENADASDDLMLDLMREMMGEEAFEAKQASEKAKKEATKKAQSDKSAIMALAVMIKAATDKKQLDATFSRAMKKATLHLYPKRQYSNESGGLGLSAIKEKLDGTYLGAAERLELQGYYDRIMAEKEKQEELLTKSIFRKKQQLQARESLPFSPLLLENPEEAFAPKGTGYVLGKGDYVEITPIKDANIHGIYKVKRISSESQSIYIEHVSGSYAVEGDIIGNKTDNNGGRVRFAMWPPQWKPIAITEENQIEFDIKQHSGDFESFTAKWDKEDILKHALSTGLNYSPNVVYLNEGGYEFPTLRSNVEWDRIVWPDLNNLTQQNGILAAARKSNGIGYMAGGLQKLLLLHVGADWKERYDSEFKIMALDDAGETVAKRFDELHNSLSDELLANPVALYRWFDADSNENSDYTNLELVFYKYAEELREIGYDNIMDIEQAIRNRRVNTESLYRGRAREEATRLQAIKNEQNRLEQEAIAAKERAEQDVKDAAEKLIRDEAADKADKAFAAAGGAQLSVEQKAAFKRLGYDAEIITKDWEFLTYPYRGKDVKGRVFKGGDYLKLEGGDLMNVTRKPISSPIYSRFKAMGISGLFPSPRKLSIWEGRRGDEIILTPIVDIEADIAFYLDLLG